MGRPGPTSAAVCWGHLTSTIDSNICISVAGADHVVITAVVYRSTMADRWSSSTAVTAVATATHRRSEYNTDSWYVHYLLSTWWCNSNCLSSIAQCSLLNWLCELLCKIWASRGFAQLAANEHWHYCIVDKLLLCIHDAVELLLFCSTKKNLGGAPANDPSSGWQRSKFWWVQKTKKWTPNHLSLLHTATIMFAKMLVAALCLLATFISADGK
jgi:hypothetical protein